MVGLKEDTTGYAGPFVDKLPVPTSRGRRGTAAVLVRTSGFYRPAEALGACRFVGGGDCWARGLTCGCSFCWSESRRATVRSHVGGSLGDVFKLQLTAQAATGATEQYLAEIKWSKAHKTFKDRPYDVDNSI